MQEALTVICEIVDEQARQGFHPIILVFANSNGSKYKFRCFRTDSVTDMNAMFRNLADTDWAVEPGPPDFGGN
jgi:hypothetical protein